jgi:hypothetical protein
MVGTPAVDIETLKGARPRSPAPLGEEDWEVFKLWIKELLQSTVVTVTFTKKDGTDRVMRCTLNPKVLPAQEIKEDRIPRKQSENTMAVYDVEAKAWRSFTIRSVKNIEFGFESTL